MPSPMNTARARSRVARWLVDECTITAPDGPPAFDPESFSYPEVDSDEVYDGPCRYRRSGLRTPDAGEEIVPVRVGELTLPYTVTGLAVGQLVAITASNDPDLIGRRMTIMDVHGATDGAYRRVITEDLLARTGEPGS